MRRYLEPGLLPFMLLLAVLPFPGTVALRLLCLAVAFAYVVCTWKRLAVPAIPFKKVLMAWAIVAFASLFYAVDPAYSLSEIKNEFGYTMMAFVAFFAISNSEKRLKWLLCALAAAGLLLSLAAIFACFKSGRWDNTRWFGGIASYATYLAATVPAAVLLGYFFDDKKLRFLAGLFLFILLAAGFYSGQRIVWPVLFLQAFVGLLFLRKNFGFGVLRISVILVALTLAGLTAFFNVQALRFQNYEWENTAPNQTISTDDRVAFWPHVSARILAHPLSGAGFGRLAMKKAYPDLIPRNNTELWHPHNVILNYGVSMGLPGIAVILLIFGALGWQYLRFWRHSDRRLQLLGACGLALVLGVFLRNMVNDLFLRDGALLFWALNGSFIGLGLRLMAKRPAAP